MTFNKTIKNILALGQGRLEKTQNHQKVQRPPWQSYGLFSGISSSSSLFKNELFPLNMHSIQLTVFVLEENAEGVRSYL